MNAFRFTGNENCPRKPSSVTAIPADSHALAWDSAAGPRSPQPPGPRGMDAAEPWAPD